MVTNESKKHKQGNSHEYIGADCKKDYLKRVNHEFSDNHADEGVDAEVIDVRSLSPIDYETIGESVRRTGRVVIVEEGPKTGGVAAEIAAGIMERCGEHLLAPVARVASADVPVPFTPVLENAYRPDKARVLAAVRELVR